MRQLSNFLLSATAVLGANALDASIFTFDPHRQSQQLEDASVSDVVASPLLALRTKSDEGFVLDNTDLHALHILNKYGGEPSPLFGASRSTGDLGRSLIILEGISPEAGTLGLFSAMSSETLAITNRHRHGLIASSVKEDFSGNLIVSSLSPSFLDNDPLSFLRETDSSRESSFDDKGCTFHANDLMTQREKIEVR